jgi:TolB-like protein/Flp pilus assembly protein TadD
MAQFRALTPQQNQTNLRFSDASAPHGAVPCDLKKAVSYIRAHLSEEILIVDLVAHCGVSERTLRKHFKAHMAVSPLAFWRQLRLAAARTRLLEGSNNTSVTEVAREFGFNHFGRFAQCYRDKFGETPSITLQRSRIAGQEVAGRPRREIPCDTESAPATLRSSKDRPSVAVLPFHRIIANADCGAFGELLSDGIATALSRARSLSVVVPRVSRAWSADLLGRTAFDIGARYILAGKIAQKGRCVRVLVRLLDANIESQLWGDIFDGDSNDLFALADRVTESIVRAILPRIRESEIERARRKKPEDLSAYSFTMRASPFVFASNPAAARQALELLHKAIEVQPDYAPATSLAAWCHAKLVLYNATSSPDQARQQALLLSDRAGILDPDDPMVLTARCAVQTMAGNLDHARALVSRSLELDPTYVWSWERSGWLHVYSGNAAEAVRHFEQATRLDSGRPNASRQTGLGCAYFDAGEYEQAAQWKRLALREDPSTAWINRTLSVSYARLGDRRAALGAVEALRRYSPDITITGIVSALPFKPDFLNRVAEGLDDLGLSR